MQKLLYRIALTAMSLTTFVVVLIVFTPQGQAAFRATLFIPQILPGVPIKPQQWFTPTPTQEAIRYPLMSGEGEADLYLPGNGDRHSAVVFFQGVVPGGRYDPRIVALAEGLARSGMVVMIPWLQTQIKQRIDPDNIDDLVHAFQYLQKLDSVNPDHVGMGGICVGASLATVAAQDDRIREQGKFVNSFAGYYDAADLAKAIGSRSRYSKDYIVPWEPDWLTSRVFQYHLIDGVTQTTDRELLTRLFEDDYLESPNDFPALSSEGQAVYRLLKGVSPEEVDNVMARLSPRTTEFFRVISPSTGIQRLKARMLIMHDRADRLVPSEESRRLADALGHNSSTYYTEFSLFQSQIQVHVGESHSIGPLEYIREALKLYMHMYNILRDVD